MSTSANGRRARRTFSDEFKSQVVDEANVGGPGHYSQVARKHSIHPNQLRQWMKLQPGLLPNDKPKRRTHVSANHGELVLLREENQLLKSLLCEWMIEHRKADHLF